MAYRMGSGHPSAGSRGGNNGGDGTVSYSGGRDANDRGDGAGAARALAQAQHAAQLNAAEAQRVASEQQARQQAAQQAAQLASIQAANDYNQKAAQAVANTNFKSRTPLGPDVSSLSNSDAKPAVASNPFISGLNNATDSINEFAANSMIVKGLDAFFLNDGVKHPGYNDYQWDTRGGDGGARAAERDADKGPMTLREEFFSYQNTPDQQRAKDNANRLERERIYQNGGGGEPMYNTKGEIIGYRDTDDNRIYSNEDRRDSYGKSLDNNKPDGVNGNMVGVSAPLSGGTYNNGFNGQGYRSGGTMGNYFSAIPDGIFNSGGSPPLMNIQTSYGNTYNGADQWTAGGNATRAAQAAATTGES